MQHDKEISVQMKLIQQQHKTKILEHGRVEFRAVKQQMPTVEIIPEITQRQSVEVVSNVTERHDVPQHVSVSQGIKQTETVPVLRSTTVTTVSEIMRRVQMLEQ